jgi:hypothetical protein
VKKIKAKKANGWARQRQEAQDEQTLTAIHEAGHAVAAILLNRRFREVSLDSKICYSYEAPDAHAKLVVDEVDYEADRAERCTGKLDLAWLIINNAGWAAERLAGSSEERADEAAVTDGQNTLIAAFGALGLDPNHVPDINRDDVTLARRFSFGLNMVSRNIATDLIRTNWSAVTRTGQALIERKTLSYDDVYMIVMDAKRPEAACSQAVMAAEEKR